MASVKVAVRVRPFNTREIDLSSRLTVSVSGNQVSLDPLNGNKPHQFTFDYSYWSHDAQDPHFVDQDQVYRDLGTDVVENAFEGYNACVFAYGQTGSGKTYTMMGTEENRGLIPRICQTMFEKMVSGKEEGTTYRTEVSYLEIYNERVKDLLRKRSEHNLRVREHPQTGPYVENLSKHLVMDYSEILALMEKGNEIRTTASTNMNDTSSRSHAIFTITFVNAGFLQGVPHETVSKIHLVDLAGSERADATGATGQRLKEGAHINKSLVTLGSVISALAEASNNMAGSGKDLKGQKNIFIPYRDSVLTWLLKDSLGGNSKTIMIATISPAEVNHSETLSTLRYANRAKNIINKPHVNEDPNVRLIRELRAEIDRLKSMMSLDPLTLSTVQKQLAVKEAQERHLTEEWTGKWKEAANILKEQRALALKRTGLGVILDSDKPHLVGIDEDVLSTGITLYHLKDGDTIIGNETVDTNDIKLKGPCIKDLHCKIVLDENGIATLVPFNESLCMVNASSVTEPTKLSQGCVLVLGKTNMFRYNDPKEAENMRQSKAVEQPSQNRSLLSHSLSDLRNTSNRLSVLNEAKLHSSVGNIKAIQEGSDQDNEDASATVTSLMDNESTSSTLNMSTISDLENNNCDDSSVAMEQASSSAVQDLSSCNTSRDSSKDPTPEEMNDLYRNINVQKERIVNCLESDQCDIREINKQISVLKEMQDSYTKMEYDMARSLWMSTHLSGPPSCPDDSLRDFDERFSLLVEQEVERRIFQEKVLRTESEFHERELLRMEKERELNEIRRQHEKEIYLLKRKLHEASSNTTADRSASMGAPTSSALSIPVIHIPTFHTSRQNGEHVEFEVVVRAQDVTWSISRRFRQFRELHMSMCRFYGNQVQCLAFPSRRLFGSTSSTVAQGRRSQLQVYLNELMAICYHIPTSPLHGNPTQNGVIALSDFFLPDPN